MDQVKFRAMKDGDAADYAFLTKHEIEHTKGHGQPSTQCAGGA